MEKFNDVINSDQLTLVDFYATWCGPCKMMHPVLEQLKADLGDSIRIIKLDVDKSGDIAEAYRIQSVPTLMLFRRGEMLWRQSGAMRLADLKATISKLPTMRINPDVKSIFDFKYEDFTLENYNPHPHIKGIVAV